MFDSGVGGLTVLHECLVNLPYEDYVYFGDTANFPYGSKDLEEVRELAFAATERLIGLGVKLLVVACNSATAAALFAAPSGLLHAHRGGGHARGEGGRSGYAQPAGGHLGNGGDGVIPRHTRTLSDRWTPDSR